MSKVRLQFADKVWGAESTAYHNLHWISFVDYINIPDYVFKLWSAHYQLANMGLVISSKCLVYILIMGLGPEYDSWSTAVRNSSRATSGPPAFDTLIAQLLDEDTIGQRQRLHPLYYYYAHAIYRRRSKLLIPWSTNANIAVIESIISQLKNNSNYPQTEKRKRINQLNASLVQTSEACVGSFFLSSTFLSRVWLKESTSLSILPTRPLSSELEVEELKTSRFLNQSAEWTARILPMAMVSSAHLRAFLRWRSIQYPSPYLLPLLVQNVIVCQYVWCEHGIQDYVLAGQYFGCRNVRCSWEVSRRIVWFFRSDVIEIKVFFVACVAVMYSASQGDCKLLFRGPTAKAPKNIENLSGCGATCAQISSPASVHISDQWLGFIIAKYQTEIFVYRWCIEKCVS